MRRSYRTTPRALFALGAVIAVLLTVRVAQHFTAPAPPDGLEAGEYEVELVVDGDTLRLTNGARVRLIGVDAPEVRGRESREPWADDATEFVREFVAQGPLRLEFDRERIDRYGRFLAYAWVGDRLLNEELVRAGLARAATSYNFRASMKSRFRAAESEAQRKRKGIWSAGAPVVRQE
jgi:micrococcal nuclease